jgi:isocitrate lyase
VKTFYHGTLPRIFFRTGHHQRAIVFSNYLRKLSAARLLAYANLLQREKRKWTKKNMKVTKIRFPGVKIFLFCFLVSPACAACCVNHTSDT